MGALTWFIKISKVVPFESIEVFWKDPFLALYFSLFSLMIPLLLCLLQSAALLTPTIWPFDSLPPRSLLRWRPHKELCFDWSAKYWCLPINSRKSEISFFSVNPHRANLEPNLLLFNSHLRFNPTPTFLGVTFDRTSSFFKGVSLLKAKVFPSSQDLMLYRCFLMGAFYEVRLSSA